MIKEQAKKKRTFILKAFFSLMFLNKNGFYTIFFIIIIITIIHLTLYYLNILKKLYKIRSGLMDGLPRKTKEERSRPKTH